MIVDKSERDNWEKMSGITHGIWKSCNKNHFSFVNYIFTTKFLHPPPTSPLPLLYLRLVETILGANNPRKPRKIEGRRRKRKGKENGQKKVS